MRSERPWTRFHRDPPPASSEGRTALACFLTQAEANPAATALFYFDGRITYGELHELSGALAAGLGTAGIGPGDRVAIILQNDPQFVIAMLAVWKAGAIVVPMNSMYRAKELATLMRDCEPAGVFCYHADRATAVEAAGIAGIAPLMVSCNPHHFQTRGDPRMLPEAVPADDGSLDILELIAEGKNCPAPSAHAAPEDIGMIVYTSGTTGEPKGAVTLHGAIAFNGLALAQWCGINQDSRILAIAPLFHITGLVCHVATAFARGASMVLHYRFAAPGVLDAIREHRPTFTIGAITAFNALMHASGACAEDFVSFDSIYSGGAPVPPSLREAFEQRTGKMIHTCFGMTETAAPTHLSPLGVRAPIDPASGALAIGVPILATDARIVDDRGRPAAKGEPGEMWVKGPQVTAGYWRKPDQTAAAITDGWLRTGDIAVMDDTGWFYLVDRKKDMIIASGFKVWPREVEDALYAHPAVREAAVIGVPDPYRGETVAAFVSLNGAQSVSAEALEAHCRSLLTGYKVPRRYTIMDDLPKTVTGKIQRVALRGQNQPG